MTPTSSLEITASRHFTAWLAEQRLSLAVTTYTAGKLFLLGVKPDGRLSAFQRAFPRCLGLCAHDAGQTLWLTAQHQIWRLENMLPPGGTDRDYDRLYSPQVGFVTGDVDAHDTAVDADGEVVFVNTLFSCLAANSQRASFRPLWQPPFVSKLAAEDRCHLNGLAMQDGRPKYVTACSRSDVADGWRDHRSDGGCVIDVASGDVMLDGLSMPHSPRVERGRLWLLNSGRGDFGFLDPSSGRWESVAFCPGYARGLALHGDWAVVGLSRPREQTFRGLPLDDALAARQALPRCGLQVIDLRSGDAPHWVRFSEPIEELYDVAVLPDCRLPKALGFQTDEIRHQVWSETDAGPVTRWSATPRE